VWRGYLIRRMKMSEMFLYGLATGLFFGLGIGYLAFAPLKGE